MIHVIHGDDRARALAAWGKLLAKYVPTHHMDEESYTPGGLAELSESRDLFGASQVLAARGILAEVIVTDILEAVQASPNIFLILEEKLDKKTLTRLTKLGVQVEGHERSAADKDKQAREKKAQFTRLFRVTDALGARDRKKAWVEYQRLIMDGVSAEEIYWKLWSSSVIPTLHIRRVLLRTETGPYEGMCQNVLTFLVILEITSGQ